MRPHPALSGDVRYFIDIDLLIDVWDELMLPPAVSQAWIDWLARHRNVHVSDLPTDAPAVPATQDDPLIWSRPRVAPQAAMSCFVHMP